MTDEKIMNLLYRYDFQQPEVIFLRHNENRTYRVNDRMGSYLLRIHDPFNDEMKGLQHTYGGLLGELQMLERLISTDIL